MLILLKRLICMQLGNGSCERKLVPTPVLGVLADMAVQAVSCGGEWATLTFYKITRCRHFNLTPDWITEEHVLALTAQGSVFAWGCGSEGQLGVGEDEEKVIVPTLVEGLRGKKVFTCLHICASVCMHIYIPCTDTASTIPLKCRCRTGTQFLSQCLSTCTYVHTYIR